MKNTPTPPAHSPVQTESECRCDCGNLLARLSTEGIELKCRRCKRIVILQPSDLKSQRPAALRPASSDVTTKENLKCAGRSLLVFLGCFY